MPCNRRLALVATGTWMLAGGALADSPEGLRLRGRSQLRYLGLAIYDAALWTGDPFQPEAFAASPLQLELTYHRRIRAQAIVQRSLDEMARGGPLPADRLPAWRAFLQRAIPEVQPGLRLAARWLPEQRITRLAQAGEGGHELVDPEFGPRFLGIWLAPHSSEPDLRRRLLGLS
jgi:hypothetical protein